MSFIRIIRFHIEFGHGLITPFLGLLEEILVFAYHFLPLRSFFSLSYSFFSAPSTVLI
jgi:hypothetical protein